MSLSLSVWYLHREERCSSEWKESADIASVATWFQTVRVLRNAAWGSPRAETKNWRCGKPLAFRRIKSNGQMGRCATRTSVVRLSTFTHKNKLELVTREHEELSFSSYHSSSLYCEVECTRAASGPHETAEGIAGPTKACWHKVDGAENGRWRKKVRGAWSRQARDERMKSRFRKENPR